MPDTDPALGLPAPYGPGDFDGPLEDWLQHLEWTYRAIVHDARIKLWGKPVVARAGKAADGRDRLFWHLITASTIDGNENTRRLDLRRAANLPRVWALLELLAAGDPRARCWREGERDVLVTPADFSFLIVLSETRSSVVLRTAYPVRRPGRQAKLRARAQAAWASGENETDRSRALWHLDIRRLPVIRQGGVCQYV